MGTNSIGRTGYRNLKLACKRSGKLGVRIFFLQSRQNGFRPIKNILQTVPDRPNPTLQPCF